MQKTHTDVGAGKLRILIQNLLVLVISLSVFSYSALAGTGSAASSFAASCYTPGAGLGVSIAVTPDASTQNYAVEDAPPSGWTVSNISIGGSFDDVNKKVKWGPFFDNSARTLSYTATPPVGSSGDGSFDGVASFDGSNAPITGARVITKCCSPSISPTSRSHEGGTDTGSISVTSDCNWTAASNASWITISSGESGSGNGTVTYSVGENTGSSRTGTITIANKTFTVIQSGLYSISPLSRSHGPNAETGSVSVTAYQSANWVASSGSAWITITSGSSGTGDGTVNYSVSANPDTSNRTGTITIAGLTFTVTQAGTADISQAAFTVIFPQIADGGGYQTTITLSNPGQDTVTGTLLFYTPSGTAWSLSVNSSVNSQFAFSIPGSGSKRFVTSGAGSIATGWASVESIDTLSGVATYEIRSGGKLTESVGVLGTGPIKRFTVPLERDSESTFGVGLALANTGSDPLTVNLWVMDEAGEVIQTSSDSDYQNIPAHGYVAKFASQAFPSLPSDFKGTLMGEVSGEGAMAVISLILKDGVQSAVPVTDFSPSLNKEIAGWWEFHFDWSGPEEDHLYMGWAAAPAGYSDVPGVIWGTDDNLDPSYGYWDEALDSWVLVHPVPRDNYSDVYMFNFTGADTVSGCHYHQEPMDGPLGECHPLNGEHYVD